MAVHSLVNVGGCGTSGRGTSNAFCKLDIKRLKKILRADPNFKFASDFDFTEASLNLLIQQGELTPIYELIDSDFTTEDNGVQTFGDGTKQLIDKKPYQIQAALLNGVQGYQNTISVEDSQVHSFFLIDKDNTVFGYKGDDGLFGGINSSFMQVMPYKGAGTDSAQYMIEFQLDRKQFDSGLVGLRESEYNFEIDSIVGVQNLEIEIPTAPIVGATLVTFTVRRDEDKVGQQGLDNTELVVRVDGVAESTPTITPVPPNLTPDNNNYTYTTSIAVALTLGQIVTIKASDGTYNIVDLDGILLQSNTAETVTASA